MVGRIIKMKNISNSLVNLVRVWLGKDGIEFFSNCLKNYGTVSPIFKDGKLPHPVHWREGMAVRNFMRSSGLCDFWTSEELDEAWSEVVVRAVSSKCSSCGYSFDVYTDQICSQCGNVECRAYKPWISGCNYYKSCPHREGCEWCKSEG